MAFQCGSIKMNKVSLLQTSTVTKWSLVIHITATNNRPQQPINQTKPNPGKFANYFIKNDLSKTVRYEYRDI